MADDPQREAAIRLIDDTIEAVGQEVCGVSWVPTAETPRAILAALIQAGWTPPGPDAWEWGVQNIESYWGTTLGGLPSEEKARALLARAGDVVVRRRPAGPWEPAPAPAPAEEAP